MTGFDAATARARGIGRRARAVPVLASSPLFDAPWYAAQAGRAFRSRAEAGVHYLARGVALGFSPHPLLEPAWWDPRPGAGARRDPVTAYRLARTVRDPHPLFDAARHVAEHPQAREHPDGPLGHWLASAGPQTLLPTPDLGGRRAELTWGEARTHLEALLRDWAAGEAVRRAPRLAPEWDEAPGRELIRRLAAAPLPPASPGQPLVSVVMPVRDRQRSVAAAVASVRAQTLPDWELIVVDDGSTDDSAATARAAAAGDPRVVVLQRDGGGVSSARNAGHAAARGRWLAWLDSDNTWHPDYLRTVLAAAHERGLRAAYAVMEQRDGTRRTVRALDAGWDHLEVANHVDLNVLVAERALVEEAGGFDETLRRAVDYDLVLRLARRTALGHVPVLGATYDSSGADRLTVLESPAWSDVVRARRLVDWAALAGAQRVPGRVSVLAGARDAAAGVRALADGVLRHAGGADVEVVVTDAGSTRAQALLTGSLPLLAGALHVHRRAARATPGFAASWALARSTGERVVLLAPGVAVHPGWLGPLLGVLDAGAAAAVPVLLGGDGTVRSAGLEPVAGAPLPAPVLHAMPPDDARRAGVRPVAAAEGVGVIMSAGRLVASGGLDPLFATLAAAGADLTAAMAAAGEVVVLDPASLVSAGGAAALGAGAADRRLLAARAAGRTAPAVPSAALAAGLAVTGYRGDPGDGVPATERGVPLPVHARLGDVRVLPGSVRARRWALKIAAPAGPAAHRWGDWHFAHALGDALTALGEEVVVDCRPAHARAGAHLDDVVLCLRGRAAVAQPVAGMSVLWVISHPEEVSDDELRAYDVVVAASQTWASDAAARSGRPVGALLQATDPERFHPGAGRAGSGEPVLFVGNSRGVARPVVRHLLDAGVEVALHGAGWERFVPPRLVRSTHVDNRGLSALYRSAGVVLNDHWDEMREQGFLSNRLFDAAASGARVISDVVPGVDALFHGLVRTYATPQQLLALVADAAGSFPDDAERARLGALVGREHSFGARARDLVAAVDAAAAGRRGVLG